MPGIIFLVIIAFLTVIGICSRGLPSTEENNVECEACRRKFPRSRTNIDNREHRHLPVLRCPFCDSDELMPIISPIAEDNE